MKHVLVVGATGEVGQDLCAAFQQHGWYVIALDCDMAQTTPIAADQLIEAQIADPASLDGVMDGVDLVVSCLGITRQADAEESRHTDYQTTLGLFHEAERAGVERFVFAHVLSALDRASLLRALDLVAECQGAENPRENSLAETPTARVHPLTDERNRS